MRILSVILALLILAPAARAEGVDAPPDMPWEIIEHSTIPNGDIDHVACATDNLGNLACAEFAWDDGGWLAVFFTLVYNESLKPRHDQNKLPLLVFSNGATNDYNVGLKWDRFLGIEKRFRQFYIGSRVTWRIQVSEFEKYLPDNDFSREAFYNAVRLNESVDILSYLDNGREIVSTLSLEGLAPLMDELVAEAREAAPGNALWLEDVEDRADAQETIRRFDRKYGITEEGMQDARQKREERLQALREKVQRLKQQQQDGGSN